MKKSHILFAALVSIGMLGPVHASVVDDMLKELSATGAGPFKAEAGKALWTKQFDDPEKPGQKISCSTCHTTDLRAEGKHVTTQKPIEPMAPSVNPKRLTERKEIDKWFKRNCKQTLGRECNAQEKGDALMYIRAQ